MAAIITERFRTHTARQFKEDFGESGSSTHIFIGRSFAWPDDTSPTAPANSVGEEHDAWSDMIAMKKVATNDVSHGITRTDWTSGVEYDEYQHDVSASNLSSATDQNNIYDARMYVMTDDYQVYKCIRQGRATGGTAVASTVKPTGTSATELVYTSDTGATMYGYIWKFMYTVTASDTIKFVTNDFIPVKTLGAQYGIDGTGTSGGRESQATDDGSALWDVENSAVDGAIYHYVVTAGGTGYQSSGAAATFTQDITVDGDGSSAIVTVSVTSGVITSATVKLASGVYSYGSGFRRATVDVTELVNGGSGANGAIKAVLSPIVGHGADPVEELGGNYLIINSRLEFAEGGGDFPTDNDFRRIGLIQDPFLTGANDVAEGNNYAVYHQMTLNSTTNLSIDDTIMNANANGNSVAVSRVVSISGNVVSHIPIANSGGSYVNFAAAQTAYVGATSIGTVSSVNSAFPEVSKYTGSILYIENRGAVSRASDQIEDIKLIIQM